MKRKVETNLEKPEVRKLKDKERRESRRSLPF